MPYSENMHVHPEFKRALKQKSAEMGLSMMETTKLLGKNLLNGDDVFLVKGKRQKRISVDTSFRFFK